MLSVLRFTDSDCHVGIFKLFLQIKMIRGEERVAMVPMGDRKRIAISTNQIASWFVCCDVTNYSSNDDFHMNWQIDQHDEWRILECGLPTIRSVSQEMFDFENKFTTTNKN